MRPGLVASLLISIVLIGGAVFYRLSDKNSNPSYGLTVVSSSETDEEKGFLDNFIKKDDVSSTQATTTTLTTSDLIGRGLISDYVNLATNNQATDDNLTLIANKYIDAIPSITQTRSISYLDLNVVQNTKPNLQKYADEFTKIYQEYSEVMIKNSTGQNIYTLNKELYAFALQFSKAYDIAAQKLEKMPVPTSLAISHMNLINSYLLSSVALKAISQTENDPASSFSGLVVWNKNLTKEEMFIGEIAKILTSNGI